MIVTCLKGGLGNQMFQYAVARSLADRSSEFLCLDVRDLGASHDQDSVCLFRLNRYPIRADIAGQLALVSRGFFVSRKIRAFLGKRGLLGGDYILERSFAHKGISIVPRHFSYLEGYWQSWKYFEWNRKNINKDFTLLTEASGKNSALLKKLRVENSVCLHVRLGDYVGSQAASVAHGNLKPSYYQTALKWLARDQARLSYYLFSDEPKKAAELLGSGLKMTIVDHNQGQPQEDLRLMSACKYFIISNSSFSWWAAWLSQRRGKRVVAPQKWFSGLKHDTRDLIPKDWSRV